MCVMSKVVPRKECEGCEFGEVYMGGYIMKEKRHKYWYLCCHPSREVHPALKLLEVPEGQESGSIIVDTSAFKSCPLLK